MDDTESSSVGGEESEDYIDTSCSENSVVGGEDSTDASFSENTDVGGEDSTGAYSSENTGVCGEDSTNAPSLEEATKKRKTRGHTSMHGITHDSSEGQRIVIEYNEHGQSIGVNASGEVSTKTPSPIEAAKKRKTYGRPTSMREITRDSSEGQRRVIEYNEDDQSTDVSVSGEDSTDAPSPEITSLGGKYSVDAPSPEEVTKKRTRGRPTSMHKITRDSSEGQRRVIEYDEDGQSIGVSASGEDSTNVPSPEITSVGGKNSVDAHSPKKVTKKRRTRGPTSMHEITRDSSEGQRRVIEYNEDGQPIGVNATKLKSFIGTCVRHHVPIIYHNWKRVPSEMKEKLYNLVKGGFVVDPRSKKNILQTAGTAFRQFKYILTTKYVMPFKDNLVSLKSPPVLYPQIEQEHWITFVNSRLNEQFEKLSRKNQEMRGKNKYNHRLSRKGYANLAEELKKSSSYDETLNGRCLLWKIARMNSEGMIVDEQTQEMVTRIDEMLTTQAQKSDVTSIREDVLSLALGTRDHSGRVRGVGNFITPTKYFHTPKPSSRSKARARQVEKEKAFEPEVLNACTALLGLDKGVVLRKKSLDKGGASRKKSLNKGGASRKMSLDEGGASRKMSLDKGGGASRKMSLDEGGASRKRSLDEGGVSRKKSLDKGGVSRKKFRVKN